MQVRSVESIRRDIADAKRTMKRNEYLSWLIRQSLFHERQNDIIGAIEYEQAHYAEYAQEVK